MANFSEFGRFKPDANPVRASVERTYKHLMEEIELQKQKLNVYRNAVADFESSIATMDAEAKQFADWLASNP